MSGTVARTTARVDVRLVVRSAVDFWHDVVKCDVAGVRTVQVATTREACERVPKVNGEALVDANPPSLGLKIVVRSFRVHFVFLRSMLHIHYIAFMRFMQVMHAPIGLNFRKDLTEL